MPFGPAASSRPARAGALEAIETHGALAKGLWGFRHPQMPPIAWLGRRLGLRPGSPPKAIDTPRTTAPAIVNGPHEPAAPGGDTCNLIVTVVLMAVFVVWFWLFPPTDKPKPDAAAANQEATVPGAWAAAAPAFQHVAARGGVATEGRASSSTRRPSTGRSGSKARASTI